MSTHKVVVDVREVGRQPWKRVDNKPLPFLKVDCDDGEQIFLHFSEAEFEHLKREINSV